MLNFSEIKHSICCRVCVAGSAEVYQEDSVGEWMTCTECVGRGCPAPPVTSAWAAPTTPSPATRRSWSVTTG